jgi:hypothetical protein
MPVGVGYGQRALEALAKGPARNLVPGPIAMFRGEQLRKLGEFSKETGAMNMAKEYFKGGQLSIMQGASKGEVAWSHHMEEFARTRRLAAIGGGGLLAANTLGIDPLGITSTATSVARVGMHGLIGATALKMGGKTKLAGMAYLGLGAVNLFRSGDNLGPM